MGKKIVIKGADFRAVAIETQPVTSVLDSSKLENNGINVIPGDAHVGIYTASSSPTRNRMRIKAGELLPIEIGQTITLTGLKGDGTLTALTMCMVIYSSKDSPSPSTLIGTSNSGNNYFPQNNPDLADSLTWTNNIGSGYLSFCGCIGTTPGSAPNVDTSKYNIQYTIS